MLQVINHITYIFHYFRFLLAFSANPNKEALPSLTFMKQKARAYSGGARFKPLDICEVDPSAEGCSKDDDDE